eukprot:sb/3463431/
MHVVFSAWTAVQRSNKIPWKLERTPLQIKTDSSLGSFDVIFVDMFDKDSSDIGYFYVQFATTTNYWIGYCSIGSEDLPVQPPVEVDKIWTIKKTGTALIITCNDVEVLNYVFADGSDSRCVPTLGGDVVEEIKFYDADTASDFYKADWTGVEGGTDIPWDLEGTPLQIKTNSTLGSNEEISVEMYKTGGIIFSHVDVRFTSPMQYYMAYCSDWTDLPVQPPVEVNKIWTITKTETALIITCNGVEVLNLLFADSSISDCVPKLGGDVVEEIAFRSGDTASDFYRAETIECPAFTVEGSTKGNWTTSPTGTITTIECVENYLLEGSATLTCQDDGTWSSDVPQCVEWNAVQRDNSIIPWDLESTPLQIKTDSTTGSNEIIYVTLTGSNGNPISDIVVKFNSPAFVYQIYYCTGSQLTDLPVQPPVKVDKTWTFIKKETAFIVKCNGVEVLNYLFADSSDNNCVAVWGGDIVEGITFHHTGDTASDFYRAAPECPVFSVEGSTQGNWTASSAGTTATIECAATHILTGSAALTCQEDGSWSSDVPQCNEIGKLLFQLHKKYFLVFIEIFNERL